ncbi:phage holin family protein [Patescibacteria group bacterium]|nr:phage holin family protein [Patescibacteria group bacterium]
MGFLINVIVTAIAVGVGAYVLPGVTVDGAIAAVIVALLLGLANASVGRLLRIITAPINRMTL